MPQRDAACRADGRHLDNVAHVVGLSDIAAIGDIVGFGTDPDARHGEIIAIGPDRVTVLPEGAADRLRTNERVVHLGPAACSPPTRGSGGDRSPSEAAGWCASSSGTFVDAEHQRAAAPTARKARPRRAARDRALPSSHHSHRSYGVRDWPVRRSRCRKTTLLAQLARGIEADVRVIALVGERGREVRDFLSRARSGRRACRGRSLWPLPPIHPTWRGVGVCPAAMTVAEHSAMRGRHVLLLADSVTRFVEATSGDRAFRRRETRPRRVSAPIVPAITSLWRTRRPAMAGTGDITAIFSVLMAGSDVDGVVADTMRGVLDGHDRAGAD